MTKYKVNNFLKGEYSRRYGEIVSFEKVDKSHHIMTVQTCDNEKQIEREMARFNKKPL